MQDTAAARSLCSCAGLLRHLRVRRRGLWLGNAVQKPGKGKKGETAVRLGGGEDMGSLVRRGQVLLGRVAAPALPSWREVEIGDTYLPLPARWDVVPGHAVRLTSCVQGGGVLPGLCCSSPRVDIWTLFLCFPWTDGRQCLLTTGSLSLASTCLPSRHLALQIQPVAIWTRRRYCSCVPVCNGPAPVRRPTWMQCASFLPPVPVPSTEHRGRE